MPAGTYYIGDLCYVMNDDEWDEFCSLTISGNKCIHGEFTFKDGRRFATYGTKWGDGVYYDTKKLYEFSVDAGLIGCIRVEDIKASKYGDIESLGALVTFEYDFITREEEGEITFGRVTINTDAEWEDQEEEEEYYN